MKTILMSMRVVETSSYKEDRNSIAYDYIDFFEKLGFFVILIPNNTRIIKEYLERFNYSMIVLSGGNNVHPDLYSSGLLAEDCYKERDSIEFELIKYSIKCNIPLLGICRGFQILNVYFGGKLSFLDNKEHVAKFHTIKSDLDILNNKNVNSYHNFVITKKELSNELRAIAYSENIVECARHNKYSILGIQWHPERQSFDGDVILINNFLRGKI